MPRLWQYGNSYAEEAEDWGGTNPGVYEGL